jgi:hypothetical protein
MEVEITNQYEGGLDILLIDDNELIQQVVLRYLSGLGYTVTVASSAAEALQYADGAAPRLMLIDLHLPDRDGPDVLDELRTRPGWANTPAVALSGLDTPDLPALYGNQFSEYLIKPVDLDVLEATVRKYL